MERKKIVGSIIGAIVIILLGVWLLSEPEVPGIPPVVIPEELLGPEVTVNPVKMIGQSVEGRAIESYTYGQGSTTLLFVGGIHGGYEWNSVLLAYQLIDALENKTFPIPENLKVVVIPTLNPDGLFSVIKKEGRFTAAEIPPNDAHTTGQGRFNANGVDLNRNFDCKWKPESTWRSKVVSAGTSAFSEPEALALKNLVAEIDPAAVVFWHSQANTVYASECEAGVLADTLIIMNAYAKAAGYNSQASFDAYPVSGDAEGWLAKIGIPAITVELESRLSPEWERNKKGIEALFTIYETQ
ncbi:MAG TPA: M14 family zinc carboxypeptidase [Candidatus Paceibacterota bacterium]|nr:M14 family zinc carboxypeptidase [Candidatus Paceibacterota bacterium]HMO82642.1 M14 family zinc carboxypeptidase [Candidatus Paceibacterota bacterium]